MRKRAKTTLEKELDDCAYMLRAWARWHKQLCVDAVNGESGELVSALLDVLGTLTLQDGRALIEFVGSQDWSSVDPDTRQIALFAIDGCILKLRQQAGLPVFDDPLEGQSANVFLTIKSLLMV